MKFTLKQNDIKIQVVDWDEPCCEAMRMGLSDRHMVGLILSLGKCPFCDEKIEVEEK